MGFFMFRANTNQSPYGIANSITVNGEGKASVKPDVLIINVSVSELAATTQLAQEQTTKKITKLQEVLSWLNIPEKNVKTTNVNTYEEFDRSNPNGRKSLGFRSQNNLSITVTGENFGEIGTTIMSEIAKIGGINIDGSYFDLKDKNTALAGAREIALADARSKAEQLVKASGGKLGKVLTITDNTYYSIPGPMYYAKAEGMGGVAMDSATSVSNTLSPGETEVTVNVNVVYKIK